MKNYKAMKSAKSWSVKKAKVIDREAISEVKDDDGNVVRQAEAEQSHEELQVVKKCFDSDTGAAQDDLVRSYSLADVKREVDSCKAQAARIKAEQDEWEQLEKDLKAL